MQQRDPKSCYLLTPQTIPLTSAAHAYRGSSRSWCLQRCSFIDELPTELRRERVALAKAVETTTQDKVRIIEAITRDDQDALTPESVGSPVPNGRGRLTHYPPKPARVEKQRQHRRGSVYTVTYWSV